jgi:hypothetical protein
MGAIDDGRKAALVFAGYHWSPPRGTGRVCAYWDGAGMLVGYTYPESATTIPARNRRGWWLTHIVVPVPHPASLPSAGPHPNKRDAMEVIERFAAKRL